MSLNILPGGRALQGMNRQETEYLYREIFTERSYCPPWELRLPQRSVIFDVGANIGVFALFARQTWPGCVVYAFEPAPTVFDVLRRNIGHLPDVVLHDCALGGAEEVRELTFYPGYTMMSGFDADPAQDSALATAYLKQAVDHVDSSIREAFLAEVDDLVKSSLLGWDLVTCRVQRLDRFVSEVESVDLLKVDVEGFELEVLHGMDTGSWAKVRNVAVEVADREGRLAAVIKLCARNGLQTQVRQSRNYSATELYMVFGRRAS